MEKEQGLSQISEYIFEVRYKPNPKIMDLRGNWAELISEHLSLPHWLIVENRIDIFNNDKNELAFVGFRNSGFTCFNSPTENYFPEKAVKFFKFLSDLKGFEKPLFVERLGVRSKFISAYKEDFSKLLDLFIVRYINLTEKAKKEIDATLIDIGAPLNFVDHLGNFNTMSGPMKKEQMKVFITKADTYPEVGLFYDIDYWSKPNKEMDINEIVTSIKDFSSASWTRHEKFINLIYRDNS